MSVTFFAGVLAALALALAGILYQLINTILDEFREGHKSVGFAMLGMVAVIVAAALPWWML